MFARIIASKHLHDYDLAITFADGRQVTMDFAGKIVGCDSVFTPLGDVTFFAQVTVDPEAGTLVWPNDVDLDPRCFVQRSHRYPASLIGNSIKKAQN